MVTWSVIIVVGAQSPSELEKTLKNNNCFLVLQVIDGLLKIHSLLLVICSMIDLTEEVKLIVILICVYYKP